MEEAQIGMLVYLTSGSLQVQQSKTLRDWWENEEFLEKFEATPADRLLPEHLELFKIAGIEPPPQKKD